MKRCVVCGNEGDDNSTTCKVCGNPYTDKAENTSEGEKASGEEAVFDEETSSQDKPEQKRPASHSTGNHPVRRMKSGPQIYGQNGSVPGGAAYGQQGMIRRNVQGRPQNAGFMASSSVSGRPMRPAQGQPNRPVNPAQASGRPAEQPTGPSGRPVNPAQASGRPAEQPTGPSGRPVNPAQASGRPAEQPTGPSSRPVNPAQASGRPAEQPTGPSGRPTSPVPGQPGRPMNAAPSQVPVNTRPAGPNPNMGRPMPGMRPAPASGAYQSRQFMDAARGMLQSPLLLLIAILHTVYLAGSIASVFLNQLNYSQAVRLIKSAALPAQVSGYVETIISLLSKLDSGAIAANLVLRIPDLLFCIGLWLIFITAMTARENMSGIGFGFVKTTILINMVVSCVVMLAVLVISVAVVIAAWVSGSISMIVVAAVVLVLIVAVVMFVIMYYFSYLATLKTCRLNSKNGEPYGRASVYVAVVHILMALFGVIDLLSGIVNHEIANIVSGAGSIGWMLLFAIWIFVYRGKTEEFQE